MALSPDASKTDTIVQEIILIDNRLILAEAAISGLSGSLPPGTSQGDLLHYNNTSGEWEVLPVPSAGALIYSDGTVFSVGRPYIIAKYVPSAGQNYKLCGCNQCRLGRYP